MSKIKLIAAALSLATFTTIVPPAFAQGIDLQIGPDGVRPVIRDDQRDRRGRDGCSARQALSAAIDEGFDRPRIIRSTSRTITVEGWTDEGRDTIQFANRPGCPVL